MQWLNRLGLLLDFLAFWLVAPELLTELRGDHGEWLRALERVFERVLARLSRFPPWWRALVALFGMPLLALLLFGSVIPWGFGSLTQEQQLTPIFLASPVLAFVPLSWVVCMIVVGELGTSLGLKEARRYPIWLGWIEALVFFGLSARGAWDSHNWDWLGWLLFGALLLVAVRTSRAKVPFYGVVWIGYLFIVFSWTVGGAILASVLQQPPTGMIVDARFRLSSAVFLTAWASVLTFAFEGELLARLARDTLRVLAEDAQIRRLWLAAGAASFVLGFLFQFIATF